MSRIGTVGAAGSEALETMHAAIVGAGAPPAASEVWQQNSDARVRTARKAVAYSLEALR